MSTNSQRDVVEAIAKLIDPSDVRRGRMVAKFLLNVPHNTNAAHVAYARIKPLISDENEAFLLKAVALAPLQIQRLSERELKAAEIILSLLSREGKETLLPDALELFLNAVERNDRPLLQFLFYSPAAAVNLWNSLDEREARRFLELIGVVARDVQEKRDGISELLALMREIAAAPPELLKEALNILESEENRKALAELLKTHENALEMVVNLNRW